MKNRFWTVAMLAVVVLLGYSVVKVFGKSKEVPEQKLKLIEGAVYNIMDQASYLHIDMDDEFSEKVFNEFFQNIDFEKKYFTQKDFDKWDAHKDEMDDDARATNLDFFNHIDSIYQDRLNLTEQWYQELLDVPFDYSKDEEIETDADSMDYVADMDALKDRWRKLLKQRSLVKYDELLTNQEKNADSLKAKGEYKQPSELEADARESTRKLYDRYYRRMKKMSLQDRFSIYLNSYLEMVDPHTNYFPPEDKEKFDVAMSGSFSGIGAQLKQVEDQTEVDRVIVGSPCYKQGDLKKGDIILKVGQGEEPPVDVTGMDIDEVVDKIRGPKGTEVRLTVQHLDGNQEVIPIVRDKIDLEETYVKSALIKKENKTIGYIMLPEFYFDAQNSNGRSCYKDMRQEIINLKKDNIDGLIVDLRNNGGGSLQDVVRIVGLFIEDGPVVAVKDREGYANVLKDRDQQVVYDGPLTILVNEGSASASEIMAAALQDYNRATIIGTTTFGKGTVQQFVDINRVVPPRTMNEYLGNLDEDERGMGSLKLTIQKFYRINGGSTQQKGVTPDVEVPDVYEYVDRGERQLPSAMPWDKIQASNYTKVAPDGWNNAKKAKLDAYVKSSDYFKDVLNVAKYLKKEQDEKFTSLNINEYEKDKKEREDVFKSLDKYKKDSTTASPNEMVVLTPDFRESIVNKDDVSKDRNKNWLEAIRNDHYVDVALLYYF